MLDHEMSRLLSDNNNNNFKPLYYLKKHFAQQKSHFFS